MPRPRAARRPARLPTRPTEPRPVTGRPELPDDLQKAAEAARGFMPPAEGLALFETAAVYAGRGPVAEIGTYCGKSTIYLAAAARLAGQVAVTVDHHRGPGEEQARLEYHPPG